jgi:hypothetical protein
MPRRIAHRDAGCGDEVFPCWSHRLGAFQKSAPSLQKIPPIDLTKKINFLDRLDFDWHLSAN